jgi:hypothetical protein
MKVKHVIIHILFLILLISCGRSDSSSTEVPQLNIEFELVHEIEPTDEYPYTMTRAAIWEDGSVTVTDMRQNKIYLFDETGQFLKTIGREGSGPGETRRISEIFTIDDERFGVYDIQQNKVLIFDKKGSHLGDVLPGSSPGRTFVTNRNSVITTRVEGFRSGTFSLQRIDPETLNIDVLYQTEIEENNPESFTCRQCPYTVDGNGNMYIAKGDTSYVIRKIDIDGNHIGDISRTDKSANLKTTEEREQERQNHIDMMNRAGISGMPQQEINPYKTRIQAMYTDHENRLWVRVSGTDDSNNYYDIYDLDNDRLIGEFTDTLKTTVFDFNGQFILSSRFDEEIGVIYRILKIKE